MTQNAEEELFGAHIREMESLSNSMMNPQTISTSPLHTTPFRQYICLVHGSKDEPFEGCSSNWCCPKNTTKQSGCAIRIWCNECKDWETRYSFYKHTAQNSAARNEASRNLQELHSEEDVDELGEEDLQLEEDVETLSNAIIKYIKKKRKKSPTNSLSQEQPKKKSSKQKAQTVNQSVNSYHSVDHVQMNGSTSGSEEPSLHHQSLHQDDEEEVLGTGFGVNHIMNANVNVHDSNPQHLDLAELMLRIAESLRENIKKEREFISENMKRERDLIELIQTIVNRNNVSNIHLSEL